MPEDKEELIETNPKKQDSNLSQDFVIIDADSEMKIDEITQNKIDDTNEIPLTDTYTEKLEENLNSLDDPKVKKATNLEESIIGCGAKWINWRGSKICILMQLNNGACPLIGIINWLILSEKLLLPVNEDCDFLDFDFVLQHFANFVVNSFQSKDSNEASQSSLATDTDKILSIIHTFRTGIHVNPKFEGINSFEQSDEISVFSMLDIPLYHTWIPDPNDVDLHYILSNLDYDSAMNKMVTWSTLNPNDIDYSKYLVLNEFLSPSSIQTTEYGLNLLKNKMEIGELAILFRFNHFSTIMRIQDEVFTLVTDVGYKDEQNVIWESVTTSGTGNFFPSEFFKTSPPYKNKQEQIYQDSLLAREYQTKYNKEIENPKEKSGPCTIM